MVYSGRVFGMTQHGRSDFMFATLDSDISRAHVLAQRIVDSEYRDEAIPDAQRYFGEIHECLSQIGEKFRKDGGVLLSAMDVCWSDVLVNSDMLPDVWLVGCSFVVSVVPIAL